eukprot:TRINITY_DN9038_c0_g1_i1.p4 TRINITY_DN9038_c0_g1~~TRINITY_DN9038_c0_g1_i1.p4  ORF type:complete len:115 (-),score=9.01 TRINITY_DN9038_c0_g1_i1:883-1227(-)
MGILTYLCCARDLFPHLHAALDFDDDQDCAVFPGFDACLGCVVYRGSDAFLVCVGVDNVGMGSADDEESGSDAWEEYVNGVAGASVTDGEESDTDVGESDVDEVVSGCMPKITK